MWHPPHTVAVNVGGGTVIKQRDYCDGRTIAAEHLGELPNPWYCRYAQKSLVHSE